MNQKPSKAVRARSFFRVGLFATGVAILGSATPALAQDPADRAAAQALFDQARDLMTQKKYAEACPKLEESNRLDPATGTKFNLADCFTHIGKTASAWTLFLDVAAAARAAGQSDREHVAREQAKALESKLSRLTINVTNPDKTPGIQVKRDDSAVSTALWGTPLPIDQGQHTIKATAPGMQAFQTTVKIAGDGTSVVTVVPELQPESAAAAPPPAGPVPSASTPAPSASTADTSAPPSAPPSKDSGSQGGGQRTAGLVIAGLGVVGVAVGIGTGLAAKSKNNSAHDPTNCPTAGTCYPEGAALLTTAKSDATISTVTFIIGGVALAGGLAVFLTAPKSSAAATTSLRVAPMVGPGSGGLVLGGGF